MHNPFAKQADKPYAPHISPEFAEQSNEAKSEALRRMIRSGLLGLGAGGLGTALMALPGLLRGSKVPAYPAETEVDLPYPQPVNKHASVGLDDTGSSILGGSLLMGGIEKHRAEDPIDGALYGGARGAIQGLTSLPGLIGGRMLGNSAATKIGDGTRLRRVMGRGARGAGLLGGSMAGWQAGRPIADMATGAPPKPKKTPKPEKKADFARSIVDSVMPTRAGERPGGASNWLSGSTHNDPNSVPWELPAKTLAGAGGVLGGSALVHYLLKKRRKSGLDSELDAAQREYDEAMLSQYDPEKLRNISSVKSASSTTNLDVCFDVLEKKGILDRMNDYAGQGAGVYMTLASLLGIGSALGTKKWLDNRSDQKTLTEALKRRAMIRNLQNPSNVHVQPVPVEYVGDDGDNG